jgi:hypothetical protein
MHYCMNLRGFSFGLLHYKVLTVVHYVCFLDISVLNILRQPNAALNTYEY